MCVCVEGVSGCAGRAKTISRTIFGTLIMIGALVVLALLGAAGVARADIPGDRVTALPGAGWIGSVLTMYSGMLNISTSAGIKSYHYTLVASENDPATDPVVFWWQGGPGCSAMCVCGGWLGCAVGWRGGGARMESGERESRLRMRGASGSEGGSSGRGFEALAGRQEGRGSAGAGSGRRWALCTSTRRCLRTRSC